MQEVFMDKKEIVWEHMNKIFGTVLPKLHIESNNSCTLRRKQS